MYIKIIFLQLLSSIICGLFGAFIGYEGTKLMGVTFFIYHFNFFNNCVLSSGLIKKNPYYLLLGTWINSDMLNVNWSFLFGSLTVTMFVVINTVSVLVGIFVCY